MTDPIDELEAVAARFAQRSSFPDAGAPARPTVTEPADRSNHGKGRRSAGAAPIRESDRKALALAGTLTGTLAKLSTRKLADLIEIFSNMPPRIVAEQRRLIVSTVEAHEPWCPATIEALLDRLGVPLSQHWIRKIWCQLRPRRGDMTLTAQIEVLRMLAPRSSPLTVRTLFLAVRSERLVMSEASLVKAALLLDAVPSHPDKGLMEQTGKEMATGHCAPYRARRVLTKLGAPTDPYTILEVLVYLRRFRAANRPVAILETDEAFERILSYLGGRRITEESILEAVREAYGIVLVREQARDIANKMRVSSEQMALLPKTINLIRSLMTRIPGMMGQEVVHTALLASMMQMVEAQKPGFPQLLSDVRHAQIIHSRFNALDPIEPVRVIRKRRTVVRVRRT